MLLAELVPLDYLSRQPNLIKNARVNNYSLLSDWGLFADQFDGSLLVSVILHDLPYNKILTERNTDISIQIEKSLNWLRDHKVLIPYPSEVRQYLLRHLDMIRLIPSVCMTASEQFGTNVQLSLELYADPETNDEYLTLYIRQFIYTVDILHSIEKVRVEYAVDLTDSSGWLLVTTDFRPPM